MVNWKLTAIAGGGAFLLSLLLGLLSEVTGGVLVLRAFFSGFFFALLISAARFALMHYLPGFGDDLIPEESGDEESGSMKETGEEFQARQVDIVLGQDDEESGADEEEEVEDFDSGDEFVPQELGDADSNVSSEPESAVVAENGPASGEKAASSGGGIADISQFESNFTGGEEDSIGEKKVSPISAEILGGVHDTEEMAKAVHTILLKDREG